MLAMKKVTPVYGQEVYGKIYIPSFQFCCEPKTALNWLKYLIESEHLFKVRRGKKVFHVKGSQKRPEVVILISDKIYFNGMTLYADKRVNH